MRFDSYTAEGPQNETSESLRCICPPHQHTNRELWHQTEQKHENYPILQCFPLAEYTTVQKFGSSKNFFKKFIFLFSKDAKKKISKVTVKTSTL